MRTLGIAALTAVSSLLIGCAATSPSPNAEQLAAAAVLHHRDNAARRHFLIHERKVRDASSSAKDTLSPPKPSIIMQSRAATGDNCSAIPVGASRALCLDRQSQPEVKATVGNAMASQDLRSKDSLGEAMKIEDERLAKRLKSICRGC